MSKPILSELEYNANDVASAILQEADLSIANEDLGIVDRTSLFDEQNSYELASGTYAGAYSFNGFLFVNFSVDRDQPYAGACLQCSDSDFYPTVVTTMPTISHEGDRANYVEFDTSGNVNISLELRNLPVTVFILSIFMS